MTRATGLPPARLRRDLFLWAASSALVFGLLFALGSALLLDAGAAMAYGALALAGGIGVAAGLRREPVSAP